MRQAHNHGGHAVVGMIVELWKFQEIEKGMKTVGRFS